MTDAKKYLVLRFKRATYHDLGGIEAHGRRLGETPHVDQDRTDQNELLIGHAGLRDLAAERILELQRRAVEMKRASLKKRRRKTELADLDAATEAAGDDVRELAEIVGWPWDAKTTYPFTEGLLSASNEWFLGTDGKEDPGKVEHFLRFARSYLDHEFGREVIYARVDRDEKTTHVSFVVAPEHEERRTGRPMLSHGQHRLFGKVETVKVTALDPQGQQIEKTWKKKSYEFFQDRVAEFAQHYGLDLERGTRRAEKNRLLRTIGEDAIERRNVSPSRGRELAAILAGEAEVEKRKAEDYVGRTKVATQTAQAKARALERGIEAVTERELDYRPPSEERPEGLQFGPARPAKKTDRKVLIDTIMPAYAAIVGIAKQAFGLRRREDEIERREAEVARQARVVAGEHRAAGMRLPTSLRDIISTLANGTRTTAEYTRGSFPDAWAVGKDAAPDDLVERLDKTSNRRLGEAFSATQDAYLLCERQDALRADYGRGVRVLAWEADRRGVDFETGRHDPAKATDPSRAHLHSDQPHEPIRVRRAVRELERVR